MVSLQSGYALPARHHPRVLILIDARFSSCLSRCIFASFNAEEMQQVVHIESVHERIARFLKLHAPEPVPAWAIEFVANVRDQQLDWRKRLRELRYDPIGLDIEVSKKRDEKGVQSFYSLKNWRDLPEDHVRQIKEFERRKGPR